MSTRTRQRTVQELRAQPFPPSPSVDACIGSLADEWDMSEAAIRADIQAHLHLTSEQQAARHGVTLAELAAAMTSAGGFSREVTAWQKRRDR